jgi:hypothetical protein
MRLSVLNSAAVFRFTTYTAMASAAVTTILLLLIELVVVAAVVVVSSRNREERNHSCRRKRIPIPWLLNRQPSSNIS